MKQKGFIVIPLLLTLTAVIIGGAFVANEIVNQKIEKEKAKIEKEIDEKFASAVSRFGSARLRQDGMLGAIYTPVFPTSTSNWTENDVIEEEWANEVERWIGTRIPSDIDSLSVKLIAATSTDPGHKHTTSTITGITYTSPLQED